WLRRQPKARSTKQKARIERAEDAKAIRAPRAEQTAKISLDATRTGKTILEFRKATLQIGELTLVKDLDFILTPGERLGIVGRNGTGKTTLLRSILGQLAPTSGEVVVGKNTKIAYFDQHRADLDDSKSIYENVADANARIEVNGQIVEVRSYLERFLFDPYKQRQPVGSLSGGERARVALAKRLSKGANLIILDEPTNDLDVATLSALKGMLVEFAGCAIIVTHDRWFLNRVATSILAFEGNGKIMRYAGNYDDYREVKMRTEKASTPPQRTSAPPPASKDKEREKVAAVRGKPLSYAERNELEGILEAIEKADAAVIASEAKLADPSLYTGRAGEVPRLQAALDRAKADAARLTARWEELETKRDASTRT
ncbi:MAG: ABC-F family ATP-binding cassette domain-containing protein, partial [Byssovorax sp.]